MPLNPIKEPTKKQLIQRAAVRGDSWLSSHAPVIAAFLAGVIAGYWVA